jgi:hypothetical protein
MKYELFLVNVNAASTNTDILTNLAAAGRALDEHHALL